MKKQVLPFALLLILTTQAKAQTSVYHPFPDSDAVWNVSLYVGLLGCGNSLVNVIYSYTFTEDTVVNSITYQKLFRPFVKETDTCQISILLPGYAGCIRQNIADKKVFIVAPGDTAESLLYDFNMQVGDTVRGFIEDYAIEKDIVYNIDSVLVGNSYRKRWNMENGYNLSFIEGLGSTYGLIGQSLGQNIGDGSTYYITCFQQNGQTLFPDTASNCELITAVKEIKQQSFISLSPNPATNQLTIHPVGWTSNGVNTSSFHNEAVTVSIMNVLGQETSPPTSLTPTISKGEGVATIDVSGLSAGIYFVQLTTEKDRWVGKFIKE